MTAEGVEVGTPLYLAFRTSSVGSVLSVLSPAPSFLKKRKVFASTFFFFIVPFPDLFPTLWIAPLSASPAAVYPAAACSCFPLSRLR